MASIEIAKMSPLAVQNTLTKTSALFVMITESVLMKCHEK
jgi:hypothetical protein